MEECPRMKLNTGKTCPFDSRNSFRKKFKRNSGLFPSLTERGKDGIIHRHSSAKRLDGFQKRSESRFFVILNAAAGESFSRALDTFLDFLVRSPTVKNRGLLNHERKSFVIRRIIEHKALRRSFGNPHLWRPDNSRGNFIWF